MYYNISHDYLILQNQNVFGLKVTESISEILFLLQTTFFYISFYCWSKWCDRNNIYLVVYSSSFTDTLQARYQHVKDKQEFLLRPILDTLLRNIKLQGFSAWKKISIYVFKFSFPTKGTDTSAQIPLQPDVENLGYAELWILINSQSNEVSKFYNIRLSRVISSFEKKMLIQIWITSEISIWSRDGY